MADAPKLHKVEGFKVVMLEPSADPAKDADWLAREEKKYPKDDFDREFLLKPIGRTDAYPVFADWSRDRHEDVELAYKRHLQFIYRGWDFGRVHPCVEFLQPEGRRINIIYEVYGDNVDLVQFASRVIADSGIFFPGASFVDWADATGVSERDEGRPSIKILQDLGIRVKYRRQEVEEGIQDIAKNLVQYDSNRPIIQLNPIKCPKLATAMRGGYKRNPRGLLIKDGLNDHPVDAFRYAHQGLTLNINLQFRRSAPKKPKREVRPLTDSEMFSLHRKV